MVKNIQNYRTVLILNLLSALSAPGKSARLGGFEGIGVLVRVILVCKSGLRFSVSPLGPKLPNMGPRRKILFYIYEYF